MGEPMLNFDEVLAARDGCRPRITHRRTTISTVAGYPASSRFVDEVDEPIRLALSRHAADGKRRSRIMRSTTAIRCATSSPSAGGTQPQSTGVSTSST